MEQSMLQGASLCLTAFAAGLRFCAGGLLPFVVHAAAFTVSAPLDDVKAIAIVARLKEGRLLVPDQLFNVGYAMGLWIKY